MNAATRWERMARWMEPAEADAIEENVRDRGVEPESDDFWRACIAEAASR